MLNAPVSDLADDYAPGGSSRALEAAAPAISWPAVLGGAFAAAALALILVALGSGFGLASVSPWPGAGASVTTFTIVAAIWLIVVQWLSAALGGYLTGRLRTKWVGVHTHEVFFRDTANGFLAWAVAAVVGAAVLASAVSSLSGAGNRIAGMSASAAAAPAYYVDMLFRSARPGANAADPNLRAEAAPIFATGVSKEYAPADKAYLAGLVAERTGLSQTAAVQRVDQVTAMAKAAADAARKAAAALSIFIAVSMLIGAFIAAAAAALGGRHRDEEWRTLLLPARVPINPARTRA